MMTAWTMGRITLGAPLGNDAPNQDKGADGQASSARVHVRTKEQDILPMHGTNADAPTAEESGAATLRGTTLALTCGVMACLLS